MTKWQTIQRGAGPTVVVYLCDPSLGPKLRDALPTAPIVVTVESGRTDTLDDVHAAQKAGGSPDAGVVLCGFSAGCQGVRAHLWHGLDPVAVVALDGTAGAWPTPRPDQVDVWRTLADEARRRERVAVLTCTQQRYTQRLTAAQGGPFAATSTILARALDMPELGTTKPAADYLAAYPGEPVVERHDGGLHVYQYPGTDCDAGAHGAQLTKVFPELLRRHIAPIYGALHDTDPAPRPGAGWLASVLDGGRSVAAEAGELLRGLLHDGAKPPAPEPPRTKPMATFPADLPCVNSVIRSAGYRPTRGAKVRLVVLHTAECAETAKSAEAVAGYFASLKDRAASAHFCVDSDSIVQCVPLSGTAWAAPGANDDGVQIELAGYAGQGAAGWADAYSVAMLDRAATLVAQLCERYSLPVAYVDEAGLLTGLAGVTTHAAVSRAFKRSTHTDPGPTFPLAAFLDSVRAKMST